MTIYFIELIWLFLMGLLLYCNKIPRSYFLFGCFSVFALVLGFRGTYVGEDTAHYIDVFNKTANISWQTILTSGTDVVYDVDHYPNYDVNRYIETGYIILNKLVRIFTSNAQLMLFLVAAITCAFMAKFIYDNSVDVFFSTAIYLCEALYMHTFNAARQMLAIAIATQAYTALYSKEKPEYLKATLWLALAFMIHKSSAVFVILLMLRWIKERQRAFKYILVACALSPFAVTLFGRIVTALVPRYAEYFTTNFWESHIGKTAILWVIEVIIVFYICYKQKSETEPGIFAIAVCSFMYVVTEIIGLDVAVFTRISLFFRVFLILLFPYYWSCLDKRAGVIFKMGMYVVLIGAFYSYGSTDARVYSFFWQGVV